MKSMKSTSSGSSNLSGQLSFRHTETVTDATSEALSVPAMDRETLIVVQPGTSAKVQYTLSSAEAIEADTAIWIDWPAGSVTEQTTDAISGAITALRLVSVGASTWEVAK